jgi:hypothetical protein
VLDKLVAVRESPQPTAIAAHHQEAREVPDFLLARGCLARISDLGRPSTVE